MKRRLAFIHTAHPAIPPLMQYYSAAAPEFDIVNLLDEGILRFFSAGNYKAAEWRFRDLVSVAHHAYQVEAAVVTCSSAPQALVRKLQKQSEIPLLKIDVPMAESAVRIGRRIGVALTFQPTLEPTTELLASVAAEAGAAIELLPVTVEGAYDALLNGRPEEHDALVLSAIHDLMRRPVDVVVLAQVSMARIVPMLPCRPVVPVLSSVETSLPAVRERLASAERDEPLQHADIPS